MMKFFSKRPNPGALQHRGFSVAGSEAEADMKYTIPSFIKINLTLRVTSRKEDGYHELLSLFMRLPSQELLTINTLDNNNVRDIVETSNMVIHGENILSRVLFRARESRKDLPFMNIHVLKSIPPGTGLGAGSGNASALLTFLKGRYHVDLSAEKLKAIGSDVFFFEKSGGISIVSGIGDKVENVPTSLYKRIYLFIPPWRSETERAYAALDEHYGSSGYPLDVDGALEEATSILRSLQRGEILGLLPNDFLPVLLRKNPEYERLFDACEDLGAQAWGITGSGSAAFAILDPGKDIISFPEIELGWVENIFITGVMINEGFQN